MRLKKVNYKKDKLKSMKKSSNPFTNDTIAERLKKSGAIFYKNNYKITEISENYTITELKKD